MLFLLQKMYVYFFISNQQNFSKNLGQEHLSHWVAWLVNIKKDESFLLVFFKIELMYNHFH